MANDPNNVIRRRGEMSYSYTPSNRRGFIHLGAASAPAYIDIADRDDESNSYALQLHHPNYLCLNFIHRQGNVDAGGYDVDPLDARPDIRVHNGAEHTYAEYLDRLRRENITLISHYVREGEDATYDYVSKQYLMLIKGAVQLFLHIHLQDRALKAGPLTVNNLKITNRELLIVGVDFVRVSDETRDTLFKEDWRRLSILISRDILQGHVNKIPDDMQSLLDYMLSFNSYNQDEIYMKNPLGLMTDYERRTFIENCWKSRKEISSNRGGMYENMVAKMGDNYGWIDDLFYNSDKHVFNHVFESFKLAGGRDAYMDSDCESDYANLELLRCARNIAAHLKERFDKLERFGDRDLAKMLMLTFGKVLIAIHHGFCEYGLIDYVI